MHRSILLFSEEQQPLKLPNNSPSSKSFRCFDGKAIIFKEIRFLNNIIPQCSSIFKSLWSGRDQHDRSPVRSPRDKAIFSWCQLPVMYIPRVAPTSGKVYSPGRINFRQGYIPLVGQSSDNGIFLLCW
jgi:hypothetical protein